MLNWKVIFKIISLVVLIVGIAMIPAWLFSRTHDSILVQEALLKSTIISITIGATGSFFLRKITGKLKLRDGYMVVALCWFIASTFGALPYFLSSDLTHPIDAFFESVAGFTTTGATIRNVDLMPRGLLLWKAISNWLGGMGILVFAISILPTLGISGQTIVNAEAPGPSFQKMTAHISSSAKILYLTYLTFSVCEFCLLFFFTEMSAFDAIVNTFGSVSTGGLFAHNQGFAYYDSIYIEGVVSTFCFLSSISFLVYFQLLQGKWKDVLQNAELRLFCGLMLGATAIVSFGLYYFGSYPTLLSAFRHGAFQVISIISSTGYAITDFADWPGICKMVLFILMFIGGCAASTSGGIKIIRILISFKVIGRMFFKRLHPAGISAIKVGKTPIPSETVAKITSFMMVYFLVFLVSVVILSLQDLDLETTIGVAAGCLGNTGLGFGEMGATGNYGMFDSGLKLYLSALMLMGRLEIFTIFLLFTPAFWKNN